ncbi:hypothetical protein pipiens_002538 [Culex pipiens pipiens]|uniref:Uncharacterized protein n=1 Tax=Culex pipiens pipiens TaxID=38569 RepID=A0ABD1DCE3_CULPP
MSSAWMKLFTNASIPSQAAAGYASEYLPEMGITTMGDIIAIQRHSKTVCDQSARDRVLSSQSAVVEKPELPEHLTNLVPVAAVSATLSNPPKSPQLGEVSAEQIAERHWTVDIRRLRGLNGVGQISDSKERMAARRLEASEGIEALGEEKCQFWRRRRLPVTDLRWEVDQKGDGDSLNGNRKQEARGIIGTPLAVRDRKHENIQTEKYIEKLFVQLQEI